MQTTEYIINGYMRNEGHEVPFVSMQTANNAQEAVETFLESVNHDSLYIVTHAEAQPNTALEPATAERSF